MDKYRRDWAIIFLIIAVLLVLAATRTNDIAIAISGLLSLIVSAYLLVSR